jgi:hypothetical protein
MVIFPPLGASWRARLPVRPSAPSVPLAPAVPLGLPMALRAAPSPPGPPLGGGPGEAAPAMTELPSAPGVPLPGPGGRASAPLAPLAPSLPCTPLVPTTEASDTPRSVRTSEPPVTTNSRVVVPACWLSTAAQRNHADAPVLPHDGNTGCVLARAKT